MATGFIVRRGIGHALLARVDGPRVVSLYAIGEQLEGVAGQIYVGRVVRVVDGLDAAFVSLGLTRQAFLAASDMPGEGRARARVREGQLVLVEVRRAAHGDKGAKVSMLVTLAKTLCVAVLHADHVAVSQSITDPSCRQRLLDAGAKELADQEPGAPRVGLVVRTAAGLDGPSPATLAALAEEAQQAKATLLALDAAARTARQPGLVSTPMPAVASAIDALHQSGMQTLYVDDLAYGAHVLAALGQAESRAQTLRLAPLSSWGAGGHQLALALIKATAAKVHLPAGGSLVINETEALTAIDVNSGQASHSLGKKDHKEAFLLGLNVAAAKAAAEQVSLRNIGGIVVVDFVDVGTPAARAEVQEALSKALAPGGERVHITKMNELGLISFTRRQRFVSLLCALYAACACCGERGRQPAAWYVASHALWAFAALAQADASGAAETLLNCAPAVADALYSAAGLALWRDVERRLGRTLLPVARQDFARGRYELLPGAKEAGLVMAEHLA